MYSVGRKENTTSPNTLNIFGGKLAMLTAEKGNKTD